MIKIPKEICLFTYTHSNRKDLWDCYFDRLDKFSGGIKSFVISDKYDEKYNNHFFILYNNRNFSSEYLHGLKVLLSLGYKYAITLLEDQILYDNIDIKKIIKYYCFLNKSKYDFVRLIKSTDIDGVLVEENLYEIPQNSYFLYSFQPTLWNIKSLINIYSSGIILSKIWDEHKLTNVCRVKEINGIYYYNGETKRGINHWDSMVYPHIASAIVKGKWNLSEYNEEITDISLQYNIDLNIRGKF